VNTDPVEVSKAREAMETAKNYWEAAIQHNMIKDVVQERFFEFERAQEAFWRAIRMSR